MSFSMPFGTLFRIRCEKTAELNKPKDKCRTNDKLTLVVSSEDKSPPAELANMNITYLQIMDKKSDTLKSLDSVVCEMIPPHRPITQMEVSKILK